MAASAVPVTMFNANTTAVNVVVNNGKSFQIGATSAVIKFKPQVPAVQPGFNLGPATPGNFGIGGNCLSITPTTFTSPSYFQVTIPNIAIVSFQVYIYWNNDTGSTVAVFLNNGQIIAGPLPGSSTPCAAP